MFWTNSHRPKRVLDSDSKAIPGAKAQFCKHKATLWTHGPLLFIKLAPPSYSTMVSTTLVD